MHATFVSLFLLPRIAAIGKVDAANPKNFGLARQYSVGSYPKVMYFSANDPDNPIEYCGAHTRTAHNLFPGLSTPKEAETQLHADADNLHAPRILSDFSSLASVPTIFSGRPSRAVDGTDGRNDKEAMQAKQTELQDAKAVAQAQWKTQVEAQAAKKAKAGFEAYFTHQQKEYENRRSLAAARKEIEMLKGQEAEGRKLAEQQRKELGDKEKAAEQQQRVIDGVRKELADAEKTEAALRKEIETLKNALADAKNEVPKVGDGMKDATKTPALLKEFEDSKQQLEETRKALLKAEKASSKCEMLEQQAKQWRKAMKEWMQQKIEQSEKSTAATEKKLAALEQEVAKLQPQLAETKANLDHGR
jgi:hypothetical protein